MGSFWGDLAIFLSLVILAIVGLFATVNTKPESKPEPIMVENINLEDGTQCAILQHPRGIGFSCDWR